jgi:hypothetical protein
MPWRGMMCVRHLPQLSNDAMHGLELGPPAAHAPSFLHVRGPLTTKATDRWHITANTLSCDAHHVLHQLLAGHADSTNALGHHDVTTVTPLALLVIISTWLYTTCHVLLPHLSCAHDSSRIWL